MIQHKGDIERWPSVVNILNYDGTTPENVEEQSKLLKVFKNYF